MARPLAQDLNLRFELQPKQIELLGLLRTPGITDIGYGGSRGGGKSRGARDVMIIRRLENKGTAGLILRRTFGELWENQIDKIFRERPPLRDLYNAEHKTLQFPNGSSIVFFSADNPGDIEKLQGREYMDIMPDEATKFSEREINFLRTCRRWRGQPDGACKLVCTMNPGGIGHKYFKRVFVDRLFQENEMPDSYAFIPAFGWDNVEWALGALAQDGYTVKDYYSWTDDERAEYFITRTQYGRDLNALPEAERIQHLLGKWDNFAGQVFPELGKIHDLDQYVSGEWDSFHAYLRKFGGFDHASTGITAYTICATDVDENFFVLDEYYQANRLISEHAAGIKALRAEYGAIDYQVADPSTEGKTLQNRDEMFSVQDAYRREGLLFVSAHRSSIAVGIDLMKEMLKVNPLHRNPFTQKLGSPRMFISRSRCPNLWREMNDLQLIDGEYVGADHACDTVRYVAMSRPSKAAAREKDISRLPPMERQVVVTHERWAKEFDKKITGRDGSWF